MIDRAKFFAYVKRNLFGGRMSASQIAGINVTLDEWERRTFTDLRWLAYMLATKKWETAHTMQPVRETMAKTDAEARANLAGVWYAVVDPITGQSYYGRGDVQLTHARNYKAMGRLLNARFGIDLYRDPDKALVPSVATAIMFEGMTRGESTIGDFTGKSLEDYFSDTKNLPVSARQVINGMDKAAEIAVIYEGFLAALTGKVPAARLLMYGMHGPDVMELQLALKAAGFYNSSIDDDFGNLTKDAVIALQRARGLTVDGVAGEQVRKSLNL